MMLNLLAGIAITIILVFVNIVGAGVAMVMGTWLNQQGAETEPLLWIIIMALATWCALTFMMGALLQAKSLVERARQ
jgi:hypothetical protein